MLHGSGPGKLGTSTPGQEELLDGEDGSILETRLQRETEKSTRDGIRGEKKWRGIRLDKISGKGSSQ